MKRITTSLALCAILLFSTLQLACGANQINRVVAALNALPPFITAFHLDSQVEAHILQGVSEGTAAFIVFRDNPTRGNLRNALAVFQSLVDRGVFKTGNPSVDNRLGPAIALVIFIMNTISPPAQPGGAERVGEADAKVSINDSQKAIIESKLSELEATLGIK